MKLALLKTDELGEIPNTIKVLDNWKYVCILTSDKRFVGGDHMYLEGAVEDFMAWLKPFNAVWIQKGELAMLQQFEVWHVKDNENKFELGYRRDNG